MVEIPTKGEGAMSPHPFFAFWLTGANYPSGGGILGEYPAAMTRQQVQEALQISRATFFRLVEDNKLPGAKKIGGSWRVVRAQLEAWLAE